MDRITNCPNCAAVINGPKCEYCGTYVVDFADITPKSNDPIYIRLNDQMLIESSKRIFASYGYRATSIHCEFIQDGNAYKDKSEANND